MRTLKGKIISAILLGTAAISIALIISYLGFNRMMVVIDDLVEPNLKLNYLNSLYRQVTRLEQEQRMLALEQPWSPEVMLMSGSQSVSGALDSLLTLEWDPPQKSRLLEMKDLLFQRDSLFLLYIRLKSNAIRNRQFARQFDTLARLISSNVIKKDTSIRTTQKKTVFTYTSPNDSAAHPSTGSTEKKSFFSRLFGRKKSRVEPATQRKATPQVKEEVQVTVDTVTVAQRNDNLSIAGKIIRNLGESEIRRRMSLAGRELALVRTTQILFNQMIQVLRQVEEEEIKSERMNNALAAEVLNSSITRMVLILLFFSLVAAAMIYLILVDISKSNFYREQLIIARDRAEELGKVKDRFLTNMSHEIRTPLQSIIGYAEQLPTLPEATKNDALLAIQHSSRHLLHIINEVLDYSRLESGKMQLEEKEFFLLESIEEVSEVMRIQSDRKGLDFYFDADNATNEKVKGDLFRFQQILYNLIGNAVKFTSRGHVTLQAQTEIMDGMVKCRCDVVDSGIGISHDDLDKIFSRFEQAHPAISSTYGGTGLGLSIVKQLVELQHGSLEVQSAPGQGSRFTVSLNFPLAEQSRSTTDLDLPAPKKVIIIDDDPLILRLCGIILHKNRIPFALHENPGEMLSQPVDTTVSHILIDLRLSGQSGWEVARTFRKLNGETIKIYGMTAQLPSQVLSEWHGTFDGILLKPFHEEDLCSMLTGKPSGNTAGDGIDFSSLKGLTMNDDHLLHSILQEFCEETTNDLYHLKQFVAEMNWDEAPLLLHKMSGRLAQMGMRREAASCQELERQLLKGSPPDLLQSEFANLNEEVSEILKATYHQLAH